MIIKDSGKQFWTDPVPTSLFGTLCQQNIRVFDVRLKLIVTFSSSDTGTRYLPKQLVGEEAVNRASEAVLDGTHTVA